VLPLLSRLMNAGIGKTRADHRALAHQLYAEYAGRDLRRLAAIVGEAALSEDDRHELAFAADFERRFIHQDAAPRSIGETLDLGWELLERFEDHAPTLIAEARAAGRRRRPA
jgi:V/A-type H+-transporting ATPase subunit B